MKYCFLLSDPLGFLTISFCPVFVLASCLWLWCCNFCTACCSAIPYPVVDLDLLFVWSVGYGKSILFPFAEVAGFSNGNNVHNAQNKNWKICMEKWNNLMFYLQAIVSSYNWQRSIGWFFWFDTFVCLFGWFFCLVFKKMMP